MVYSYDLTGQLTGADWDAGAPLDDESYDYDLSGNRTAADGAAYTTGDRNQTTFDGTYHYTYLCPCQLGVVDFSALLGFEWVVSGRLATDPRLIGTKCLESAEKRSGAARSRPLLCSENAPFRGVWPTSAT